MLRKNRINRKRAGPQLLTNKMHQELRAPQIVACLTLATYTLLLVWWGRVDTLPAAWDESVHLHLTQDYMNWLAGGATPQSRWMAVYPPLYHFSLIPSLQLSQWLPIEAADAAILTHVVYLALLLWALGSFAHACVGTAWPGVIAAAWFAALPMVLWTAHRPLIDFGLTAWVAVGVELLRRSRGFQDTRATSLWAIWSGLGLLLKPFYPLWLAGPVLWSFFWTARLPAVPRPWRNAALALVLILVVALPYYAWQGIMFVRNATQLAGDQGTLEGDPGFQTLAGWIYYLKALGPQLSWLYGGLVAAGMLWTLSGIRKEQSVTSKHGLMLLLCWILSGYLLFTFNHNKDLRYTLPLLPALILLALWRTAPLWQMRYFRIGVPALSLALLIINGVRSDPPVRMDWQHEQLGKLLSSMDTSDATTLRTTVLSNHPYFFGRGIGWSLRTQGLSLVDISAHRGEANFSEFVIFKNGDLGPYADATREQVATLKNSGRSFDAVYPQVAAIDLPDGSQALVHRRVDQLRFEVEPLTQAELERRLQLSLTELLGGPVEVHIDGQPDDWRLGQIAALNIVGGPWQIGNVPVDSGHIVLSNARLNLYSLWDHGDLGLMGFDALYPDLTFSATSFEAVLQRRARNLTDADVQFAPGHLRVSGNLKGITATVDLGLELDLQQQTLEARLQRISIAGIPLPGWLIGKAYRQQVSLKPVDNFPGRIAIERLEMQGERLRVVPAN